MLKYIVTTIIIAAPLMAEYEEVPATFMVDRHKMLLLVDGHLYRIPRMVHHPECQQCQMDKSD